jgi:ferric-dicitrate binding protein FerR (iron transport regulator)
MSGSFDLMQGAMFFDRPEDEPKSPVTIKTLFGQLGVRGTRFFAGPNRDVFAVFVERGSVEVSAGGFAVQLQAGDGVDIPSPGSPPSDVKQWGEGRIKEVYAAVGLDR